ncbi:MAG TPA: LON peptidase substrate-binding domain-containing protein [Pirellulales bacterium]|jgi:ATP-dependent Lon protease|nr:LON peptidase substrate-binding domain-containing protein [Pirellulales bacterium]
MSLSENLSFSPENFSGRVRLFPLPNLVVFPHVMQPLHIFEPRYRAMLEEALADDRLIGMSLLAPGWEQDYEGRPPLRPVGCLCRVATYHKTDEGSYNVLVLGLRRMVIERELPAEKTFRVAEVQLCEDRYPDAVAAQRPELQRRLLAAFKRVLPRIPEAYEQLDQLLGSEIPLGMLTDIVAYTLDIELDFKERLLTEAGVDQRAQLLLEHLNRLRKAIFPPEFSIN